MIDQVRALLRQPEVVVGTWRAARVDAGDLTEAETRAALERLDPLWDELFPAEQARIVQSLVERVDISAGRRHDPAPDGGAGRLGARPGRDRRRVAEGGSMNTMTVTVPLTIRRRGGRKVVVAPEGAGLGTAAGAGRQHAGEGAGAGVPVAADAGRWPLWRRSNELAAAEKINSAYVSRVLRLTLLAPDIVEAILDGRRPGMTLPKLMGPFPGKWEEQLEVFEFRLTQVSASCASSALIAL